MQTMNTLNNILTFTLIFTAFGVVGLLWVYFRKKYLPTIEYKLVQFLKKILRTDNDIDLLIDKEEVANLEYKSKRGELWIIVGNKRKLLTSPKYGSDQERLIEYLLNNPNKKILRQELIDNIKLSDLVRIPKIISDLKLTGNIRKLFIKSSNQSITLFNPITKKRAGTQ